MCIRHKSSHTCLSASLALWIFLSSCYAVALNQNYYVKQFDYVVYAIQLGFDILIFCLAYLVYRNRSSECDHRFYMLLFLSLLPGLLANESYNFLINILDIKHIDKQVSTFWSVTYMVFLALQIYAWMYLLITKFHKQNGTSPKSWFFYLPYIQSIFVILLSLASLKLARSTILYDLGAIGILNSLLEIGLYGILVFCLSRTKNKSLIMIEFGFLILIAFNLAHRFSHLSGESYKLFNVLWMLSLILISYGLFLSSKFNNERIECFPYNSIHVLFSNFLIVTVNLALLAFVIFDLMISMVEIKEIKGLEIIIINTPAALIFLHSIFLFSATRMTEYLSKPFENLIAGIHRLDQNKLNTHLIKSSSINIYEVEKFTNFVTKTINDLRNANRVKSEFLMNMSHDFRTPASGIYNMARSISKRLDNLAIKDHMQLLINSSEKLLRLLESILDYSILDKCQHKIDQEKFDIKEIIHEVIVLILPNAINKGIKLQTIDNIQNKLFITQRTLIHRILLNVISNAVKFTYKGSITIISSTHFLKEKHWLIITVKDTGIGIDKAHHQAIFEPFYQVQSSRPINNNGTGLGLSNVKSILHNVGGKIEITSQPGHGSEFTLYIPII